MADQKILREALLELRITKKSIKKVAKQYGLAYHALYAYKRTRKGKEEMKPRERPKKIPRIIVGEREIPDITITPEEIQKKLSCRNTVQHKVGERYLTRS